MTSHSPTPWTAHEYGILDANGYCLYHVPAGYEEDDNATINAIDLQHIVDCVNRCHERDELINGAWTEYVDGVTKHMPADVAEETRRLVTKNSTLTSEELSSN